MVNESWIAKFVQATWGHFFNHKVVHKSNDASALEVHCVYMVASTMQKSNSLSQLSP